MGQNERKFKTEISIKTVVEGTNEPFFEGSLTYHGLPVAGVSMIEKEVIGMQQRLRQQGDQIAEAMCNAQPSR